MMPACAAVNCYNRHYKGCGKTFHVFPLTRPELAEQWLENMQRDRWFPARKSALCSDHFEERCFDRTGATVRLRENAVPTIFDLSRHSAKVRARKPRKPPKSNDGLGSLPTSSKVAQETEAQVDEKESSSGDEHESGVNMTTNSRQGGKHALGQEDDDSDNAHKKAKTTSSLLNSHPIIKVLSVTRVPSGACASSATFHNDGDVARECAAAGLADMPLDHDYAMTTEQERIQAGNVDPQTQNRPQVSLLKDLKPRIKVTSLTEIVKDLQRARMLPDDSAAVLQTAFDGEPAEVLNQLVQTEPGSRTAGQYPLVLRTFALTLLFCSSKAYEYVRKTFDLDLPPISVVHRWYRSSDGEPGFTEEVFSALRAKVEAAKSLNRKVVCSLSMSDASLQQNIEWDGHRVRGFTDVGTSLDDDDSLPAAKRAVVFMVTCLNGRWNVSCGYFLCHSFTGGERANLIQIALQKLHAVGVQIVSVTFDSPNSNFSTIKSLGGNLNVPNLVPWFPHPSDGALRVYCYFDVCQTLRLVRHCFASAPYLVDGDNQQINWSFILDLHRWLEKDGGARAGSELRSVYVNWAKHKTDVNKVAPTLCANIADALDFCCHDLKLEQFRGCEGTVKFIRTVVGLCDILSSSNPLARNFKSPLRQGGDQKWRPFLRDAERYLLELKDHKSSSVYFTNRRTGYVAFLVNIMSTLSLCDALVMGSEAMLDYFPTNRVSMDNMELFFNAVRTRDGSGDVPTARRFIAAYKSLITDRHCSQDPTVILSATADFAHNQVMSANTLDVSELRRREMELLSTTETTWDYDGSPNIALIWEYMDKPLCYVCGYVICMVEKLIFCAECITALHKDKVTQPRRELLFVRKDTGVAVTPSSSVVTICHAAERCLKRIMNATGEISAEIEKIVAKVRVSVLQDLCDRSDLFGELQNHMFDMPAESNHIHRLLIIVADCYIRLRLHHLMRKCPVQKEFTRLQRKQLCRTIYFP